MLPKPKHCAAIATQARELIIQPLNDTGFEYRNTENDAGFLPGVCRVCLATNVTIHNISEGELSDMYERVTGFVINAEDRLPRQLCWECVGRLSSANRFVAKAIKTHWLLLNEINSGRLVTIRDIETIDKARHKLESTLNTKINNVNEYDFLFTEETVKCNTCGNMHTSKPAYNDYNEDISDIEFKFNEEEQIFVKEEFTSEIDPIKTEQVAVDVEEEDTNNYTTAYNSAGIDEEKGDTHAENVNISYEEQAISIKQESISVEDVLSDDETVSEMSRQGRQLVDKSSEVCEVIRQSQNWSNNSLSPQMPPGCKEDIGLTIYKTEHSSKKVTDNVEQSTTHITNKMKNEKSIKSRIILEDDEEFSADFVKTCKLPQSVINASASTSHNKNTNKNVTRKISKSLLSGSEYPGKLFICDICNKSFHHKLILILHIENHPKMHYCTYCNYKTCYKGHLKEHVNAKHTRTIFFNCAHCSYKTYKKSTLSIHINARHTKSKVLNCPHCSYKTCIKWCLLRHVAAKHTKSNVFNCPLCSYKACEESVLSNHVNTKHSKNEVLNCPHCSYKTFKKSALSVHVSVKHTKTEVLNCPHCSYRTYIKWCLLRHINAKHTKSDVFNCPHCSYRTYVKFCLLRHINSKHSKSDIFNCTLCRYKAYSKSNLSNHVNAKHTKSRVFNCPHCNYKAYQKSTLTNHVNAKHTKSRVFNCPHCNYKVYQKSTLTKHVNAKHTKSDFFNCSHCSYYSYFKQCLIKHLTDKHAQ